MANLRPYMSKMAAHLSSRFKHNLATIRSQPLLEISGAFGDLGTFIPIFVALVSAGQVSGPSTLVFSGISNILTGIVFGIPLPVQPMKAIAAIALQKQLSNAEIAGAGLFVAAAIGLLSLSGLLDWFMRVVPVPVIKGIQVGAGISLMISASAGILPPQSPPSRAFWETLANNSGLLIVTLAFLLTCTLRPRIPFVLVIVVFSIIASLPNARYLQFRIWQPTVIVPTGWQFLNGALSAGLGQLPLTTLNSVLAVAVLAQDLFPAMHEEGSPPSAGQIGISVTLMNIVSVWFRSMPFCHGSGGLAAQYRFGARSGASIIILGCIKLLLGLFAGDFVLELCKTARSSGAPVLGVLLFLAGLELARMGQNLNSKGARDLWDDSAEPSAARTSSDSHSGNPGVKNITEEVRMRRWTIMMVTIGSLLGAKNDGIGFAAGMILHWTYMFIDWYERRREGRIRLQSP